ncbi:hypothetical protein ABHO71_000022 [Stenotrophomonas maltophilia]|uniref:hypothetical protein n=1 Tax=Stenotrophomonas TaxID=40323 RepID=UPI001311F475|nr:hypothetical protein [Stenotrophomonas maltophilia]MBN5172998.1 hypothetical protein [Stenotrophomonas maltophilia]UBB22721.1 hypothetical protein LAD79_06450 [Stenotrophomonas maltophilia]HEL3778350.1 hypothetical protein [Stenotrophomonas maltophilia]HEL5006779.1 hypothetical protein [Stenotrophomonas maltophilia]
MSFDSKAKTEAALIRRYADRYGHVDDTFAGGWGVTWGKLLRALDKELADEKKQRQELAAGKREAVWMDTWTAAEAAGLLNMTYEAFNAWARKVGVVVDKPEQARTHAAISLVDLIDAAEDEKNRPGGRPWREAREAGHLLGATRTLPEGLATFREQLNGDLLLTIGVDERGERVVASVRPIETRGAKDHVRMFFRSKSIAEVDQHNYFKLEVEKCGLAEAFGMPWAQPALKDALLQCHKDWLGAVSDFMAWEESLAIKDASEAQTAFDAEEDPQAAPAMALKAREAERLKDAKMALTARNEARAELLDFSLPAPAPSRKGTPF